MAVYAVGDIQGCYDDLMRLLESLRFDQSEDQLWLAGDLVNRGPKSLEVLRFARNMGPSLACVLGNHDLHLLAVAYGARENKRKDTLSEILEAPDSQELLDWLRHQPLLHRDKNNGWTMVHAGISPQWSMKKARKLAKEVETVLQSDDLPELLESMYGNTPERWSKELVGMERYRYIINAFTRMRYCKEDKSLDMSFNQAPEQAPEDLIPWYVHPRRKSADKPILFGHWSTLGYRHQGGALSLDTGCVWGGKLTAVQLPDTKGDVLRAIHLPCQGELEPHA